MRLGENTGRKNSLKSCHLRTIVQIVGLYVRNYKACIDNRKNLLNSFDVWSCKQMFWDSTRFSSSEADALGPALVP